MYLYRYYWCVKKMCLYYYYWCVKKRIFILVPLLLLKVNERRMGAFMY